MRELKCIKSSEYLVQDFKYYNLYKTKEIDQIKKELEDAIDWVNKLRGWGSEYLESDINIGECKLSDLWHDVNNSGIFLQSVCK